MRSFRSRRQRVAHKASRIFLFSKVSTYVFYGLIGFVIVAILAFVWYSRDLPTPGKLVAAQESQSTRIFDRTGVLLYSVYSSQNRAYVNLSDIPKDLQHATIAIEDKNFYKNSGFSPISYLRVIKDILFHGRITGGSGITQQLVRNTLISSERTLPRKIKELILAIQVDKKYSKNQILEMYLNDVSYGGANVGVEAASETYFGKHVKDLDLAESALLAGLPQGPSLYDPLNGNKYYIQRSKDVLAQMVDNNYVTKKQSDSAFNEIKAMEFSDKNTSIKAPHFVMYIKQLLVNQLHFTDQQIQNGGLQVTTSLDYAIQKKAEEIVDQEIEKLKGYHVGNGAAVVSNPKTGEILSMVGSKDYFDTKNDGNYNAAIANRQPGSSLKPIMYAVAFEKGYTPATMVMDSKTDFPSGDPEHPTYTPVNYDGKEHGPVEIRFALGNSLNIPAVKMLARVGIKDVMQQAYQMGIQNWDPTPENAKNVGLSLVLGGRETTLLDEVTAYGVFANKGIKQEPVFILKVTDSHGNVLYQEHPNQGQQVLSPEISFLISHILLDNNARIMDFGPNSWLVVPGKTVSVKTGTTDQKRDNWTVGFTPSFVVGVWVGNNDNSVMNQAISSGVTGASPIWNKIMTLVLKGKSDEAPLKPDNVVAVNVDSLFGGLQFGNQPTRSEYFIKGTEPTTTSPVYKDKDGKTYYVIKEDDPVSTDGKNRWQEGIDAWTRANHSAADFQWFPPSELINPQQAPNTTDTPTPTLSPTP